MISFKNLKLFWKLLVPFLTLVLVVGAFGVFLIVRDLASRAEIAINQDLASKSLEAMGNLRERELYLLESANFASNVEGITGAVASGDKQTIARLLQSVLALKTDLNLLAATDASGSSLVEFTRAAPGEQPSFGQGGNWAEYPFVTRAIGDAQGNRTSGFVKTTDQTMLAIVAPVCTGTGACKPVGSAIVGISSDQLVAAARGKTREGSDVAIYDSAHRLLAKTEGSSVEEELPNVAREGALRRTHVGSSEVATRYSPLQIQGRRTGTLAVSIPTAPAYSAVKGARFRLSVIVLLAMAGVVGIGAALSRLILRQVNPLVETNRALGRGDLWARAPVVGGDELGELARGVNQMAEQLQASYETLESRVAERTEEVQRLLKERTEFFASLSHELRTPLAVILAEAKMMYDPNYAKRNGSAARRGRVVEYSAQQLLSLVNDILDLARAEAGSIEVNVEDVDFRKLVNEMKPTIEEMARGNGLDVSFTVPRDLPPVRVDPLRLRQIVLNLVDNAAKYTPEGGNLQLVATANSQFVEFSVADTGVGIPSEEGDLIFEPFYRVKGTRVSRGEASTGLGLALTKRLVEAQGGTIEYDSQAGSGTTFRVRVPVASKKRAGAAK